MMKQWKFALCVLGLSMAAALPAQARDTKVMFPVAEALAAKDAQEKLAGDVQFFFGDQKHPRILARLGSDDSGRKTNAFGKSDQKACNWVFLSVMLALEKRAHELGANAVVNIVSYYNEQKMSSETEFECHAGAIMAGVALKGDFVKIAK